MKSVFSKVTPKDLRTREEQDFEDRIKHGLPAPVAPAPVSDTVVGSVVVMLDKSYQAYLSRRATLEADIARQQELLRQTNTVIASLEAALTVAAVDPALTVEEAGKAGAPLDRVTVAAIEPSMGFEVGELKPGTQIPANWYDMERGE